MVSFMVLYKSVCVYVLEMFMTPIYRIHHQKSRYVYELFYKRKAISRGMLESVFVHTTLS